MECTLSAMKLGLFIVVYFQLFKILIWCLRFNIIWGSIVKTVYIWPHCCWSNINVFIFLSHSHAVLLIYLQIFISRPWMSHPKKKKNLVTMQKLQAVLVLSKQAFFKTYLPRLCADHKWLSHQTHQRALWRLAHTEWWCTSDVPQFQTGAVIRGEGIQIEWRVPDGWHRYDIQVQLAND